jgi:hypothetical protein
MSDGPSSVSAAIDAQFGLIRVLLPFPDFENVYQGQAGNVPIAFPGDRSLMVGQGGYDPNLARAFPVPFGSRIAVSLPICENDQGEVTDYRYGFIFRDRSVGDFRRQSVRFARQPYHYWRQGFGTSDTTPAVTRQLYPIASRHHALGYEQTEPGAAPWYAQLDVYPEWVVPHGIIPGPLLPDGVAATISQGIYDPTHVPDARRVMRAAFWLDAGGDELIILVTKVPDEEGEFAAWNFDTTDAAFSNIYGRGGHAAPAHNVAEDGGIHINTGSNP